MVFPDSDHDNDAFGFSNNQYTFTHKALGADKLRYSTNFGQNWTDWRNWEDVTTIDSKEFSDEGQFWDGQHIMVQCKLCLVREVCDI